jgi:hypothetical protein
VSAPNGSGKTLKDLREVSEALGYEGKEHVKRTLELGGLGGNFQPALWRDYVACLVVHAQKVEQLLWRATDTDRGVETEPCPVCGAETVWLAGDGARTAPTAWRCLEGGELHYWWTRANRVRESIGLPPADYAELERLRQEREKRDEVVRRLYWKSILGRTTDEEQREFEEAYGSGA